MNALPPGTARMVYAFPEPASLHACKLLHGVFGTALQTRHDNGRWLLGARIPSCACTVLAMHEVYEAGQSDRHRDLAAHLAAYPSERVFRCVHERDLGRVLQRGVLEGLAEVDTCLTSDVSLALEGARMFGAGCYLLVFELAVGLEAVAPYEAVAVPPQSAGAHVCTVVNAERTLFRPQYPDQLLLHLVLELEVYACQPAASELQQTPMCNPVLDMQRAHEKAPAPAAGSSVHVGNSHGMPFGSLGFREQLTAPAAGSSVDAGNSHGMPLGSLGFREQLTAPAAGSGVDAGNLHGMPLDSFGFREQLTAPAAGSGVDAGNLHGMPLGSLGFREQLTAPTRNSCTEAERMLQHAHWSLDGAAGNVTVDVRNSCAEAERILQHAAVANWRSTPWTLHGARENVTADAADARANMCRLGFGLQCASGKMPAYAAQGVDLYTAASCALPHATEAGLCAADIFRGTNTSPVVDAVGCGSWELGETYVCDFVPKSVACSAPAGSAPDSCDAHTRRGTPPNGSKRGRARTRAGSPNMVRCSALDHGAEVVMRNMIQPFKFCEGERGLVWHVQRGKRPLFWVIAHDMNVSMQIVNINSGRKNYHAPCMILMLQRYQLEQCVDVVLPQREV